MKTRNTIVEAPDTAAQIDFLSSSGEHHGATVTVTLESGVISVNVKAYKDSDECPEWEEHDFEVRLPDSE